MSRRAVPFYRCIEMKSYTWTCNKTLQLEHLRAQEDVMYRCERGELVMVFAGLEGVGLPHSRKNRCLSGFSWTWQGGDRGGWGYLSHHGDRLDFPFLQKTNIVKTLCLKFRQKPLIFESENISLQILLIRARQEACGQCFLYHYLLFSLLLYFFYIAPDLNTSHLMLPFL